MTKEAVTVITSLLVGLAVGFPAGMVSEEGISFMNAKIEIGTDVFQIVAIFAIGIAIVGFLWTLHKENGELRERIARLEATKEAG